MAAFIDPIVLHVRAGLLAITWADPYEEIATVTVQWDRRAYLSGVASKHVNMRDMLAIIACVRKAGQQYEWTEIFWIRKRKGKPDKTIRIPIKEPMPRLA